MKFRVAGIRGLSSVDLDRWRRLADAAVEPNPNADPRFLHASLGFGLGAEDVRLAIVESGEEFALVMPFTPGQSLFGVPLRHVTTSGEFMFDHASKNHPLVWQEDPVSALRELFLGLRSHRDTDDLVSLTVFPADGPLAAAVETLRSEEAIKLVERSRDRRAFARRADLEPSGADWPAGHPLDYPMPHLSKRTRRNARKNMQQIEALADAPLMIARHDGDAELIEEFLQLQADGWKGDASKDGPQFRRRGREAWFRAVLDAFAADTRVQAWHVTAGHETVYIAFTLTSGGATFGFHDVYSDSFRRFSPGTVGRLALLGAVLRDPAAPPFDPGMEPTYAQASSIFPSQREHVELLVSGGSLRSRAVVASFPRLRRLRELIRRGRTLR